MTSPYPTYATHTNRDVRVRPPETTTDIKDLWKECSAIQAQLAMKSIPKNGQDRQQDQLDRFSYTSRIQELPQPSSGSTSARTTSCCVSQSPPREEPFTKRLDLPLLGVAQVGDEDMVSTRSSTLPDPIASSIRSARSGSSYSEVRDEIAQLLHGDRTPARSDTKDVRDEIARLLGGSAKKTDPNWIVNELEIPPTKVALTILHVPAYPTEAPTTDLMLRSLSDLNVTKRCPPGGYPRIAEEVEWSCGSSRKAAQPCAEESRVDTEEAVKQVPPCPLPATTADEIIQRMNYTKVEIAKQRKLQAKAIQDSEDLEAIHKCEIETFQVTLEKATQKHQELSSKVATHATAGVKSGRLVNQIFEDLTSTGNSGSYPESPRRRLMYASELPYSPRKRSSLP